MTAVPEVPASWLFGSVRDLQRDQLAAYQRAMSTLGECARFRIGPPPLRQGFDAFFTPAAARQVLATHADAFVKDAPAFDELRHLLGTGLVTAEGELWRRQRRTIQPLFTRRRIGTAIADIAADAMAMVDRWRAPADRGGPVDLVGQCGDYALGVLGRVVLGDELGAVAPTMAATVPLLNGHAARRGLAAVRMPHGVPTPANRAADAALRRVHSAVDGIVTRHRTEGGPDGLLDRLVAATDPDTGAQLTDEEVRDQVVTFLIVGHETTASSLAFTLDQIGRHDDVQRRVRGEVRDVLGDGQPSPEDLGELRYTTQVVHEALRLFPAAHTLVRRACPGADILGTPSRPGRTVAVSVWGIHHSPDVWPDPHTFDPGRFDPDRPDPGGGQDDRYAHLPFGGGPRKCIGVHLAMAELVVATAMVVRAYQLRSPIKPARTVAGLALAPVSPMPCWPTRIS